MTFNTPIYLALGITALCYPVGAADWPQFRGPEGRAIAHHARVPWQWDEGRHLAWKYPLPGPGSSSPVVTNECVFVTCYSGYAEDVENPGEAAQLQRHVVCVDRRTGQLRWEKTVAAVLPEAPYERFLTEHGYASNTPATDGQCLYVFFGKTGVLAYDFEGNELWRTSVGTGSVEPHWSSVASVTLHGNMLIVNASDESQAIWGLNKATGDVSWKYEDPRLRLAVGTPAVSRVNDRHELVLACPDTMLGICPDRGELLWSASILIDDNIAPSISIAENIAYATGGLKGGTTAVRLGGKDDVSESHVLWSSKHYSYVPSPVVYEGNIYCVDQRAVGYCITADTGELIYRERLPEASSGGQAIYASPVVADGRIYVVTRFRGTFVIATGEKWSILAHNVFASDDSQFNATPAIADTQVFLRSNKYLYCIASPETPSE